MHEESDHSDSDPELLWVRAGPPGTKPDIVRSGPGHASSHRHSHFLSLPFPAAAKGMGCSPHARLAPGSTSTLQSLPTPRKHGVCPNVSRLAPPPPTQQNSDLITSLHQQSDRNTAMEQLKLARTNTIPKDPRDALLLYKQMDDGYGTLYVNHGKQGDKTSLLPPATTDPITGEQRSISLPRNWVPNTRTWLPNVNDPRQQASLTQFANQIGANDQGGVRTSNSYTNNCSSSRTSPAHDSSCRTASVCHNCASRTSSSKSPSKNSSKSPSKNNSKCSKCSKCGSAQPPASAYECKSRKGRRNKERRNRLEGIIDYTTCMVCLRAAVYHGVGDQDDDCDEDAQDLAKNPCRCEPFSRSCCGRWSLIGVMLCCLPLLVFYPPVKLCLNFHDYRKRRRRNIRSLTQKREILQRISEEEDIASATSSTDKLAHGAPHERELLMRRNKSASTELS